MIGMVKNNNTRSSWLLCGRFCALILILILALVLTGCRRKKSPPPTPDANQTTTGVQQPITPVVATIGDRIITADDVTPLVQEKIKAIQENPGDMPVGQHTEYLRQREREFTQEVTDTLIAEALLDEQVKREGITVSDQEIEEALQASPPPPDQNPQAYRKRLVQDLAWRKLFEPLYAGKTEVTVTEIQKYYEANAKTFNTPEQVRVSHILLDTAQRAEAESLLEQIKGGADFATLARTHSLEKISADKGGDVGFFEKGDMEAAFEKAALALQPGQIGPLVQTSQGLHILKVTERKPAVKKTLEEARDDVKALLIEKKKTVVRREYIKTLRKNAGIAVTP